MVATHKNILPTVQPFQEKDDLKLTQKRERKFDLPLRYMFYRGRENYPIAE